MNRKPRTKQRGLKSTVCLKMQSHISFVKTKQREVNDIVDKINAEELQENFFHSKYGEYSRAVKQARKYLNSLSRKERKKIKRWMTFDLSLIPKEKIK